MDAHDEQYRTKKGLRYWPENELARFIGKTYGTVHGRLGSTDRLALDLGCGTGRNSWLLYESGFDVHAIDASGDAVTLARRFVEDRVGLNGITVSRASVQECFIGVSPATYDLVVDIQTIQHLSWLEKADAFQEIADALKPGGRFFSMHWCGLAADAHLIYGGAYPELDFMTGQELQQLMMDSGLKPSARPYLVTRNYPDLRASASWLILEAVKA